MDIHPYAALMRRYCIDYTAVHDLSVCPDIMREDYRVTVSGRTLGMDQYVGAVEGAFSRFPTLDLTVHDMMISADRLAMRFSEHGASSRDDGRVAVWRGISLYRWDGSRLRTCEVEQDFLSRDRQLTAGTTARLDPAAPDPWAVTTDEPANPEAEQLVRAWFRAWVTGGDRTNLQTADCQLVVDASDLDGPDDLTILDADLEITDLFSAGAAVAVKAELRGTYGGGLPGVAAQSVGRELVLPLTAIGQVEGAHLSEMRIIRDRWGLQRRLR
ncbi:ester cyclase [Euzebya tangerina]|uniref:ester cyclase n=1 Tax=Euzebya tangerina TaxID=591198 RepID=UPI000E323EAD|nr:ester cyclase [Euzebya tangerina]